MATCDFGSILAILAVATEQIIKRGTAVLTICHGSDVSPPRLLFVSKFLVWLLYCLSLYLAAAGLQRCQELRSANHPLAIAHCFSHHASSC